MNFLEDFHLKKSTINIKHCSIEQKGHEIITARKFNAAATENEFNTAAEELNSIRQQEYMNTLKYIELKINLEINFIFIFSTGTVNWHSWNVL